MRKQVVACGKPSLSALVAEITVLLPQFYIKYSIGFVYIYNLFERKVKQNQKYIINDLSHERK